ncbi:hypothetical protein ILUMI_26544 [Ignelater luminosus]|uniref:V-type proton ATPase subunit S1 n=1 Tax=Ignelater luminosus TaxID=2038154 RepID=A0A8K0FYK1_IGNLU|nr:hypothetical protein ILUMI_26544 [Ignelater luminosus]
MSEHNFVLLFLSVYVFTSLFVVSSTEYVPVYMWETTQFSEVVPALERVSPESFKDILSERAGKATPILVFAEQTLSSEDLMSCDGDGKTPFVHLSSQKNSAQISYWPFVKNPIKVLKELPDRNKIETSIKSILNDHSFVLRDGDILIVDLNDAHEGEDRLQMLKRHDQDITTVYKRFAKEHNNVITLFTGHHPSWITSEELRSHRRVREAGQAKPKAEGTAEDTFKVYNNTEVLIFVNSTPTLNYNGTMVSLADFVINTTSKSATNMTITFSSDQKKDITLDMQFTFGGGYWIMDRIVVLNKSLPEDLGQEYNLIVKEVFAPLEFSYQCYSQAFYNGSNRHQNLSLPGLQIQPFFNTTNSGKFGYPYDCVGFMSAPIWSGLFVTLILALIMTFGLTMMMDIKTMDRFDDPKGKTITIGAIE